MTNEEVLALADKAYKALDEVHDILLDLLLEGKVEFAVMPALNPIYAALNDMRAEAAPPYEPLTWKAMLEAWGETTEIEKPSVSPVHIAVD